MIIINPIGDSLEVGTRPHWDEPSHSLYYVDVTRSTIYKYKPSTSVITKAKVGNEPLAFAFPVEGKDDMFVAGLGRKLVLLRWDGVTNSVCTCKALKEVDRQPELSTNRFNGGKVDPYGRLWAGTMGGKDKNGDTIPGQGSLYSYSKGKLEHHLSGIGISNGIAFDVEQRKMYYVDTLFAGIYQFDYNGESGEIGNQKVIFRFEDHCISGLPDGLTIDTDGNLWLAVIFGSAVLKIDPKTGSLLKKVEMPTSQITALTFGNNDLNVLYVNSAQMPVDGKIPDEPAGSTFKLEQIGRSKGLPGDRYKLM